MKNRIILTTLFAAVCAAAWFYFNQQSEATALDYGDPNAKFRYTERKNLSPYAMFGDSSVVLLTEHERLNKQFMEVMNSDKKSEIHKIEFDQRQGRIRLFNKSGEQLSEALLDPEIIARFLSVDPRADKYLGWSPYNYVMGNPIRNTDPRGDTVRVTGSESANNRFNGIVNRGLDGFYTGSIGADGTFSLTATGKEGTMNKQQKAFFKILSRAVDAKEITTLNVFDHADKESKDIRIGDAAVHGIDVQDIEQFGSTGFIKESGVLAHEVFENYLVQAKGTALINAHNQAASAESLIHGYNTTGGVFNESLTDLQIPVTNPTTGEKVTTVGVTFKNGNIKKIKGN
jgi:hypothetical protein